MMTQTPGKKIGFAKHWYEQNFPSTKYYFFPYTKNYLFVGPVFIKRAAISHLVSIILSIAAIVLCIKGAISGTGFLIIIAAINAGIPFVLRLVNEVIEREIFKSSIDFTGLGFLAYVYWQVFTTDVSEIAPTIGWPPVVIILSCATFGAIQSIMLFFTS